MITEDMLLKYGQARFAAGFYFVLSFLDEETQIKVMEEYKKFSMSYKANDVDEEC